MIFSRIRLPLFRIMRMALIQTAGSYLAAVLQYAAISANTVEAHIASLSSLNLIRAPGACTPAAGGEAGATRASRRASCNQV
jgi:hypothetical protein